MISNNYTYNPKCNNINFGAKKISHNVAKKMNDAFLTNDVIYFFGHKSPDEDAIQSMKVLYDYRAGEGKKSFISILNKDIQGLFFKPTEYKTSETIPKNSKSLLVDCNSSDRASSLLSKKPLFITDHHLTTTKTFRTKCYIDNTAKSCCAVIYRFFESIGKKLEQKDLSSLYCGVLSDYEKSKLIEIKDLKVKKLPELDKDKNAKEVLENLEKSIPEKDKSEIISHLDILSNLTPEEESFRQKLFNNVQFTKNGNLAYVIVPKNDKQWRSLGMDTPRSSAILRDFRIRLITNDKDDKLLTPVQKELLKNTKGVMAFYRSGENYSMSIHAKDNYSAKLIKFIQKNINPNIEAGGHPNRGGGRIHSLETEDIRAFIKSFIDAANSNIS